MSTYIEDRLKKKAEKPKTPSELLAENPRIDVTRPKRSGIMLRLAKFHKPRKREWNCTCVHTRKHHKSTGRCRGNCSCTAGLMKSDR